MKTTSLFYKHLTLLDYAFFHKREGVRGNSLIVDVEFEGKLDEEGILFDFSNGKKAVKRIIDELCDHRFVLPKGMLAMIEERAAFEWKGPHGVLYYEAPLQAFCEIEGDPFNKRDIARYLESELLPRLPENIEGIRLNLREESLNSFDSSFHYTHGLRGHYGNCQRLFHGHSNTLVIEVNGQRRRDLEQHLVSEVFENSVHFCFFDNVVNKADYGCRLGRPDSSKPVVIQYQGNQGLFKGILPAKMVYFLPIETTVENLSAHFYELVRQEVSQDDKICVSAFEGIAKGATTRDC